MERLPPPESITVALDPHLAEEFPVLTSLKNALGPLKALYETLPDSNSLVNQSLRRSFIQLILTPPPERSETNRHRDLPISLVSIKREAAKNTPLHRSRSGCCRGHAPAGLEPDNLFCREIHPHAHRAIQCASAEVIRLYRQRPDAGLRICGSIPTYVSPNVKEGSYFYPYHKPRRIV